MAKQYFMGGKLRGNPDPWKAINIIDKIRILKFFIPTVLKYVLSSTQLVRTGILRGGH